MKMILTCTKSRILSEEDVQLVSFLSDNFALYQKSEILLLEKHPEQASATQKSLPICRIKLRQPTVRWRLAILQSDTIDLKVPRLSMRQH